MPGFAEVSPYLHVSTHAGWEEMGRWYWNLVEDQLAADDNVVRAAAEAAAGARTVLDKVRAVHRFVLENTRYVALEFGIHGYKPYRVAQVLSRRFGDCKDKASLMLALLREVGVPSELVLLRTRRGGRVESSPASLAVFDHAIVYVPALSLYLDGTAEFAGLDELPFEDQGVTALRVGPQTAELVQTPVLPAASNRAVRRWQASVDENGGARVAEEIAVSGQAAPEWREHYQTPGRAAGALRQGLERPLSRAPGSRTLEIDGPPDRNRPVVARSVALVPKLADPAGAGRLKLPVSAREEDFVRSYARLSQRRHELVLAYPWQQEQELSFRVPEGWQVEGLPAAAAARLALRPLPPGDRGLRRRARDDGPLASSRWRRTASRPRSTASSGRSSACSTGPSARPSPSAGPGRTSRRQPRRPNPPPRQPANPATARPAESSNGGRMPPGCSPRLVLLGRRRLRQRTAAARNATERPRGGRPAGGAGGPCSRAPARGPTCSSPGAKPGEPDHPVALFGQAALAFERGQTEPALDATFALLARADQRAASRIPGWCPLAAAAATRLTELLAEAAAPGRSRTACWRCRPGRCPGGPG